MALDEDLNLNLDSALGQVDALEARINAAASAASEAFVSALGDAVGRASDVGDAVRDAIAQGAADGAAAVEATLAAAAADVSVTLDTSSVETAIEGLPTPDLVASVDTADAEAQLADLAATGSDTTIDVTADVDTTQITDADTALTTLADTAATPIEATIQVDDSQVNAAADSLSGLQTSAADAASYGSVLTDTGQAAQGTTAAVSTLTSGVAGLEGAALAVSPELAAIAGAATAAGVGLKSAFDSAVAVEAASQRLTNVLGDEADAFKTFDGSIGGFQGTLKDLALTTGSSASGLTVASANLADLGKQAGYSGPEIRGVAQQYAVLASYVSASRPELGTADVVAQRLGQTLQRGGRFAQQMGLDLGTAAQIADRASQMFDKPKESLSGYEKTVAGLAIAYEKVGDRIDTTLSRAGDNPVVALRILERQLKIVAAAAGGRILEPVLDTLKAAAPAAENAATVLSRVAEGGIKVFAGEARVLGVLLSGIARILNNEVVSALVAAGGGFFVARGSINALLSVVARLSTGLAGVALRLNVGDGIASQFSGIARASTQISTAFEAAEVAGANFATANEALTATLADVLAEQQSMLGAMVEGSVSYDAATAAVEADTVVQEKNVAVLEASIAVRDAAAAKQRALIEAQLASGAQQEAADAAVVATTEALTEAESVLASAQAEQAVAAEAASTANATLAEVLGAEGVVVTEAATAASVASTELAGATAATEDLAAASVALNPVLLGLAAAAALAVGAFMLFSGDNNISADANEATSAVRQYGDAVAYTSAQLANSSQDALRRRFQQEKEAADAVRTAIRGVSEDAAAALDAAGAFSDAGAAVRGDRAAQQRTRAALIRSGDLQVGITPVPDASTDLSDSIDAKVKIDPQFDVQAAYRSIGKAIQAAYAATGNEDAAKAAGQKAAAAYGLEFGNSLFIEKGDATKKLDDLVAGQREAEKSAVSAAKAQIELGHATQTDNIAYLASIGLLDRLTPAERERARQLLLQADAAKRAADQEQVLGGIRDQAIKQQAAAVFTGNEALQRGRDPLGSQVAAARALVASDGFKELDQSIQDAANALVEYGDKAIQTANANGDLFASTGELAIGMGDLQSRLDQAADAFVNILSKQQALGASTRTLNNLLDDLVPTTKKLGTALNETDAAFDLSSINADNYEQYLALLPKAVQDAIEGRNQAVDKANRDLAQAQKDRPLDEGLLAQRYAEGEFVGGLASGKDGVDKAEKSREQKAAEVRAAIAQNGEALDQLQHQARDNARELADMFDQVGIAIRKEAAEMLKSGATTEEVTAQIRKRRDELIAAAEAAGFTNDQINQVLDTQRLLPTQVAIDLKESGVDKIVGAIERLATVMAGLDQVDAKVANAIRGIEDPTKQVEAFNQAIASLPAEQQTKLRLIYDVPDPEAFKAEQTRKLQAGAPFRIGVQMGLDRDSALALDQEFADVISKLPSTASLKITPEIVTGVQEFDQSIKGRVGELYAIIQANTDPQAVAAAQEELKQLTAQREALITAFVSPESLTSTQAQLAQAALERTVTFKTQVDPVTGKTTAQQLADIAAAANGNGGSEYVTDDGVDHEHQAGRTSGGDGGNGGKKKDKPGTVKPKVDPTAKKEAEDDLNHTARPRNAKVKPEVDDGDRRRADQQMKDLAKDRKPKMKPDASKDDLDKAESALTRWARGIVLRFKAVVDTPEAPKGTTPSGGGSSGGGGGSSRSTPQPAPTSRDRAPAPTSARDRVVAQVHQQVASLPIRDYTAQERGDGVPATVVDLVAQNMVPTLVFLMQDRKARFPGFAAGGTTVPDDELERLSRQLVQRPTPGLYPASAVARFAELSTRGEYFVSRDPSQRALNQTVVRLAAADLGVTLPAASTGVPSVATPGPLLLDRPTLAQPDVGGLTDAVAALAGAARQLVGVGAGQGPQAQPQVNLDLTVLPPPPASRPSRVVVEDVRSGVVTGK